MSESIPSITSGFSARLDTATAPAKPGDIDVPGRLAVGSRVEIRITGFLASDRLEVRLKSVDASGAWSAPTRVQLAAPMVDQLAEQLTAVGGKDGAGGRAPRLQAEVISVGQTLVLRLIGSGDRPAATAPLAPPAGTQEWMDMQFRQQLPQSRPLGSTLASWADQLPSAPMPGTQPTASASGATVRMLQDLLAHLPTVETLTDPNRLRETLKQSGIWLEALLARSAASGTAMVDPHLDLKAQLLNLAGQLGAASQSLRPATETLGTTAPIPTDDVARPDKPDPLAPTDRAGVNHASQESDHDSETLLIGRLTRDVDGMIKQVTTQQLQSLESPAEQPRWLLELPYATGTGVTALQADIRHGNPTGRQEDESWCMQLRLDLPRIGPLAINLSLRAERLNASLQAGTRVGAELLKSRLSDLRKQLEARDIDVASLYAGYRVEEMAALVHGTHLLNERA